MSILIIEPDHLEFGEQEAILKKSGYAYIQTAKTISEAMTILGIENSMGTNAHFSPGVDLIIIGMTSVEECAGICRKIKDSFLYQDVPVIVVTNAVASEAFPFVVAYGAFDFIRQPFSEMEYLARVRAAIKLKHEMDRRKAREKELIEATRQLADLNSMLVRLSLIDSMTGIANRRNFDRVLDKEWRRAIRSKLPISVMMIDVDYFKLYNDTYGHPEGDECLKQIAQILKDSLKRPADALCRYGGEEFVIILPDTPAQGAEQVGETLRQAVIRSGIAHKNSKVLDRVTVSIGIATMLASARLDPKDLVQYADKALYEAKAAGRNQVVVSKSTQDSHVA